ncbi:hypothetical protein [Enterococcus hermanniensis]|uniref:hypothetical protein n=1 Tax=Enterococcus hermanniensis TaxID=249189 RepID=UPI000900383B|nr:hypothetical protein [Enterococcus hermanniensis]
MDGETQDIELARGELRELPIKLINFEDETELYILNITEKNTGFSEIESSIEKISVSEDDIKNKHLKIKRWIDVNKVDTKRADTYR